MHADLKFLVPYMAVWITQVVLTEVAIMKNNFVYDVGNDFTRPLDDPVGFAQNLHFSEVSSISISVLVFLSRLIVL